MASRGIIDLGLRVNTTLLKKGLQTASAKLNSFVGGLSVAKTAMVSFAGAVGAGLVVNSLKDITKASMESLDALAKMSDRLAIDANVLRAWQHGAGLSGSSAESFSTALEKLGMKIGQVKQGSTEMVDAFQRLGLSLQDIQSLNTEETFRRIVEGMNQLKDPTEQAAIAAKLFEEEGVKMLNFLSVGADGLKGFEDRAGALAGTLSRIDLARVELANDAVADLKFMWRAVGDELAIRLAPIVMGIAKEFTTAGNAGGAAGAMVDSTWSSASDTLITVADTVWVINQGWVAVQAGGNRVLRLFGEFGEIIGKVSDAYDNMFKSEWAKTRDQKFVPDDNYSGWIKAFNDSLDERHEKLNNSWNKNDKKGMPSEWLPEWIAKTKTESDKLAAEMEKSAKERAEKFNALAGLTTGIGGGDDGHKFVGPPAPPWLEELKRLKQDLQAVGMTEGEKATHSLTNIPAAIKRQIEGLTAQLGWREKIVEMQQELASIGMTDVEKILSQFQHLPGDIAKQIKELGEAIQLKEFATNLKESLKTPLEVVKEEVDKINKAAKANLITEDQRVKALKQLQEENKIDPTSVNMPEKFSQAFVVGTQEARRLEIENKYGARIGRTPQDKVADETKKSNKHLAEIQRLLTTAINRQPKEIGI